MTPRQRLHKRKLLLRRLGCDHTWPQMTERERRRICHRHSANSAFYVLRKVDKALKERAERKKT